MDFVGELHLDLVLEHGAVPVVVPRVPLTKKVIDAFEPFHGMLVVEGEDIDEEIASKYGHKVYNVDELLPGAVALDREKVKQLHASDTATDTSKDELEFAFIKRVLKKGIPYLGLCRGSQLMNVAMGGTLYMDVETEIGGVQHIDYKNYDGHRHNIRIVPGTPLEEWFGPQDAMPVNSYHHQGVRRLAEGLKPMAYTEDGLIEAYYDPSQLFRVGLQFHPERMLHENPNGAKIYSAFVEAVKKYHKQREFRIFKIWNKFRMAPPLDDLDRKQAEMIGATVHNYRGSRFFLDGAEGETHDHTDKNRKQKNSTAQTRPVSLSHHPDLHG